MVNITNITNINTFVGAGEYANSATSGAFWGIMLVAIFIIILLNTRRNGIENAVAGASFSILLLSVFMFYLGWVNIWYPVISVFMLAGTLFVIRFKER